MAALKLVYFPIGGRALPIRVCLKAAGIDFEDQRLKRPEIEAVKATGVFPLGQVPALFIDGKAYCQSTALARFAAKKAGLYPTGRDQRATHSGETNQSVAPNQTRRMSCMLSTSIIMFCIVSKWLTLRQKRADGQRKVFGVSVSYALRKVLLCGLQMI